MLIENLRVFLRGLDNVPNSDLLRSKFVSAYNNESPYRSRNRRPRTDLMVKGLMEPPFDVHGVIGQLAAMELNLPTTIAWAFSYERYFDLAYFDGDWWNGTQKTLLVAEVENNWAELRGTIHDLLYAQSLVKWGVLYHSKPQQAAGELVTATQEVRAAFDVAGFCESAAAKYEILVLPERLPSTGLLGLSVAYAVFGSRQMREFSASTVLTL